jgi:hypothetical protein
MKSTKESEVKNKFIYFVVPVQMIKLNWANPSCVLVYSYMLNKYQFFMSRGLPYYENQETIAEALGMSERTIRSSISLLAQKEFLYVYRQKVAAGYSNSYRVENKFNLNFEHLLSDTHYEDITEEYQKYPPMIL